MVVLPAIAADNLMTQKPKDKAAAEWMKKSNAAELRACAIWPDPKI